MQTTIKIRRRTRSGKPYGSYVADVLYPDGRKEELTTGVKPPGTRADALSWVQNTLASRAGASGFSPPEAPALETQFLRETLATDSPAPEASDARAPMRESVVLSPADEALAKAREAWGAPLPKTPDPCAQSAPGLGVVPVNPTANTERMRMVAGVVARWLAKFIFKLQDKLFTWMRRVAPSADPDEIKLVEWGLGEWAGKLFGARELTPGVAILLGLGLSTVGRWMGSTKLPPLPPKPKAPEPIDESPRAPVAPPSPPEPMPEVTDLAAL